MGNRTVIGDDSDHIDIFVEVMCGNEDYLKCMNVNLGECRTSLKKAFDTCPTKYYEAFELDIVDSVCVTNNFVENMNTSDETAIGCESFLYERDKLQEELEKRMPNKALQPTPESDPGAFGGSFPRRRG